jgi:hypothetical protein
MVNPEQVTHLKVLNKDEPLTQINFQGGYSINVKCSLSQVAEMLNKAD